MPDKREPEEPKSWALSGCALTFVIWLFAAMLMLFTSGGDCISELGHSCPSDHERAMSLVWVGLGAAAVNVVGLFLLGWLHAQSRSRR
jgi:hypothetical protein